MQWRATCSPTIPPARTIRFATPSTKAIYADLLPGERRSHHLRLARALREHPDLARAQTSSAAELAHHWYAAGQMPEALTASISAGTAAEELGALADAWLHYERALEIWDRVARSADELPFDRLEVLRRAADAAMLTGEQERAITLAQEMLARIDEHDDPIQAALAHERLGRYIWTAGHDTDALPAYRRAVELIPAAPPTEARARVLAAEGQVLMLCNRTTESIARCEEALAIARSIRAEAVEAHVLNTTCGNLSAAGEFEQAITAARQALAICRRLGLVEEVSRSYMNGSDALDEAGRIEESIAMAREGIESARELGFDRQWGDLLRGEVAGRLLQLGRWNEAEHVLGDVIDRSPTGVNAGMAYRNLGFLWAERGAFDAAARALDQAEAQIHRSLGSMTLGPPAAARASLELWANHPEAAASLVSDCLQRVGDSEYVFFTARVHELGTRACAEIAARAAGDAQTAAQQAAAARETPRPARRTDRAAHRHHTAARARQSDRGRGRMRTDRAERRRCPLGRCPAGLGGVREPLPRRVCPLPRGRGATRRGWQPRRRDNPCARSARGRGRPRRAASCSNSSNPSVDAPALI